MSSRTGTNRKLTVGTAQDNIQHYQRVVPHLSEYDEAVADGTIAQMLQDTTSLSGKEIAGLEMEERMRERALEEVRRLGGGVSDDEGLSLEQKIEKRAQSQSTDALSIRRNVARMHADGLRFAKAAERSGTGGVQKRRTRGMMPVGKPANQSKNAPDSSIASEKVTTMLDLPWLPPNPAVARLKQQSSVFSHGTAPICCSNVDQTEKLGPGVQLYFSFLKYMAFTFAILSLVSAPTLFFAVVGDRTSPEWLDALLIARTALSNSGPRSLGSNKPALDATSDGCNSLARAQTPVTILGIDAPFEFQTLTLGLALLDVAAAVVFLVAAGYFRSLVRQVSLGGADSQLTLAQYTVLVRCLPPDATEEEVRDHFSSLYNLTADDWTSCTKWTRRPKLMPDPFDGNGYPRVNARGGANRSIPTRSGRHNRKHGYKDSWVADVQLLCDLSRAVDLHDGIEQAMKEVTAATLLQGKYSPVSPWRDPDLHATWTQVADERMARVKELKIHLAEAASGDASMAFVTFNCEESWRRCVEDFGDSTWAPGRMTQPARLRLGWALDNGNNTDGTDAARGSGINESSSGGSDAAPAKKRRHRTEPVALKVEPSPAPEDLVLANLGVSECSLRLRRCLVCGILALFLLFCLLVFAAAETAAGSVDASFKSAWLCANEIPSSAAGTRLVDPSFGNASAGMPTLVRKRNLEQSVCRSDRSPAAVLGATNVSIGTTQTSSSEDPFEFGGTGKYFLQYEVVPAGAGQELNVQAERMRQASDPRSLMQVVASVGGLVFVDRCAGPCVDPGNAGLFGSVGGQIIGGQDENEDEVECPTLGLQELDEVGQSPELSAAAIVMDRATTYPPSLLVDCYCQQELTRRVTEKGPVAGAAAVLSDSDSGKLCQALVAGYMSASGLMILAGFVTTLMNMLLRAVLHRVTAMELHLSRSLLMSSLMQKLFVSQFINSAVVLVAINARVPVLSDYVPAFLGVFQGDYDSLDDGWHARVGVGVVAIQLFNIVMPHLMTVIDEFLVAGVYRCWNERTAASQAELEEAVQPSEFNLEDRYAIALVNLAVTLMFSAGYPILFPVAALSFAVTYWVDMALLLRVYKKPERVGAQSAQFAAGIMPALFLLHLAFAWWSFSDDYFMPSMSMTAAPTIPATCSATASSGPANDSRNSTAAAGDSASSALLSSGAGALGERTEDLDFGDGMQIGLRLGRTGAVPILVAIALSVTYLVWMLVARRVLGLLARVAMCGRLCGLDAARSAYRENLNPPLTADFQRLEPLPKSGDKAPVMAPDLHREGWRYVPHPERHPLAYKRVKVFTSMCRSGTKLKKFGDRMRTWEFIAQRSAPSYSLKASKEHRGVAQILETAAAQQQVRLIQLVKRKRKELRQAKEKIVHDIVRQGGGGEEDNGEDNGEDKAEAAAARQRNKRKNAMLGGLKLLPSKNDSPGTTLAYSHSASNAQEEAEARAARLASGVGAIETGAAPGSVTNAVAGALSQVASAKRVRELAGQSVSGRIPAPEGSAFRSTDVQGMGEKPLSRGDAVAVQTVVGPTDAEGKPMGKVGLTEGQTMLPTGEALDVAGAVKREVMRGKAQVLDIDAGPSLPGSANQQNIDASPTA